MKIEKKHEDYTEKEFLELTKKICNADFETEDEADMAVCEFVRISEHPSGTDIIFYPLPGQEDSPEGIVKFIKDWRAKNGKPGFRNS